MEIELLYHSIMLLTPEEIRDRYEKQASTYDWKIRVLELFTGIHKMRRNLLQKAMGNVLVVGIGTGRDLKYFPSDCSITGIDLSKEMLKVSKRRAEQQGLDTALEVMDIESLRFEDNSFDTVTSSLALCTFPHPEKALQEMKRACKPNGTLLFLEHGKSSNNLIRIMQTLLNERWIKRIGCHLDREPEALITDAGMRVVSHRRSFFGILHAIEAKP